MLDKIECATPIENLTPEEGGYPGRDAGNSHCREHWYSAPRLVTRTPCSFHKRAGCKCSRRRADVQGVGNFFVKITARQQFQHFAFARRKITCASSCLVFVETIAQLCGRCCWSSATRHHNFLKCSQQFFPGASP